VKAVIFDVDGTLIDSVDAHARAWQEAFADYGYTVGFAEVRSQIGKGGDQLMPVFVPAADLERIGDALEQHRGRLFKARYLPTLQPFPGVRALMERILATGAQVALASSAKADEVIQYERLAGIDDLVHHETSSDDAERSKPYPDIFQAALAKLRDVSADQAVVVGDTPWDAEAAGKAGLATIGVLCGGFPEGDLRAAGCRAIYADPADLLARFDTSPLNGR
jgi:HAD superfamily hydrolase (TIGR01509 family)